MTGHDPAPRPRTDLDLVAVLGLALALTFVGTQLSGLSGERLEWRLYMISGTVFPAILAGVPMAVRKWPGIAEWIANARTFLRFLGVTGALALVIPAWDVRSLGMAVICVLISARFDPVVPGSAAPVREQLARWAPAAIVLLAACHALPRLIYPMFSYDDGWTYVYDWERFRYWSFQTPYLLAMVAAFALVLERPAQAMNPRWRIVAFVVAGVVLIAGAMRLPDFSYWIPYHHWGVFVGPVDLVRAGGVPLWDTPTQYGFLSTVTTAMVPFVDSWEAFRIVAGLLLWFSAMFIFTTFFSLRPGPAGFVVALGLAFAGVLVVPGETHHLRGVFCYPSFGAFRFWPAYAFMGVAWWEAGLLRRPGSTLAPWIVGSVLWVFAVLWAVEGAVYATATWLPALVWSRTLLACRGGASPGRALVAGASHLVLPFALLALTCAGMVAGYRAALGAGPDLRGYLEYAVSFKDFLPLLIQPLGPGLVVFVVFLLLSAALTRAFTRADRPDLQVVALAAWGATWSAASYFVPRSPPANATALLPVLVASLLVIWKASDQAGSPWNERSPRWIATALFGLVLFTGTYEPSRLPAIGKALMHDPYTSIETILPRVPKRAERLLYQAGVQPGEPIISLSPNIMGTYGLASVPGLRSTPLHRSAPWLPLFPAAMAHPLTHDRWRVYVDRYIERQGITGGWYLIPARRPYLGKGYLWKLDLLMDERFPATERWSNTEFVLEWRGVGKPPRQARVAPVVPLPTLRERVPDDKVQYLQP